MGEHEQGGMLRNVVVLGLIALIASVITLLVVNLTTHMKATTHQATNALAKVPKPYVFAKNDVTFASYTTGAGWNGQFYRLPQVGSIPSHNWREIHFDVTPDQDFTGVVDLNVFIPKGQGDATTAPGVHSPNWNDAYSKVSTKILDVTTGKSVAPSDWHGTGAPLTAGHTYTYSIRYYNDHAFELLDHTPGLNDQSSFVSQSNGKAVTYHIDNFEAATYEDD